MTNYLETIAIAGNSLAASLCALSVRRSLPENLKIVWIRPQNPNRDDALYGNSTSPEAYELNLNNGVSEPELILETNTSFSLGTKYANWGQTQKSWMQCFHLPFPSDTGVAFQHLMTRFDGSLEDYLIGAQAALHGAFAHPPSEDQRSPLSEAEYGYHFSPAEWSELFYSKLKKTQTEIVSSSVDFAEVVNGEITRIRLGNNQIVEADLYIDCTGTDALLRNSVELNDRDGKNVLREVALNETLTKKEKPGPAYRHIEQNPDGWRSITPLRNKEINLTLTSPVSRSNERLGHTYEIGHRSEAWKANCVSIGLSAYVFEPVSPAPYSLLSRDIKRLLELIPIFSDYNFERQEYNRQFKNDILHALSFQSALYHRNTDSPYLISTELQRKLSCYAKRGVLASYDFEPFNEQDWCILLSGMGIKPKHYDKLVEQLDADDIKQRLKNFESGIKNIVKRMPPHHVYLEQLTKYLMASPDHG